MRAEQLRISLTLVAWPAVATPSKSGRASRWSQFPMKHTQHNRSDCPINFALETFGDPWSLLIIRDIVYFGKNTYGEFFVSEEGMATNILASRLAHLEQQGILVKKLSEKDKRKEEYVLTEKGLDLIPVLVEMANWSAQHDPHTAAPAAWIALMKTEREKMIRLIREKVQSGGSVFGGEKSLLSQARSSGDFRFWEAQEEEIGR